MPRLVDHDEYTLDLKMGDEVSHCPVVDKFDYKEKHYIIAHNIITKENYLLRLIDKKIVEIKGEELEEVNTYYNNELVKVEDEEND